MNELNALRWVLNQPGLKLIVGKDRSVTLIYGHSFEVAGDNLVDAVIAIQKAQIIKDDLSELPGCKLSDV